MGAVGQTSYTESILLVPTKVGPWGIQNLAEHIKQLAGPRGNVWVIGVQNVGKSTLINAIGKHVGLATGQC